jgi:hypothetical protein
VQNRGPIAKDSRGIVASSPKSEVIKGGAKDNIDSSEEGADLLVSRALSVKASDSRGEWIVDSGATNVQQIEISLGSLELLEVVLGDGHTPCSGGTVTLEMNVPNGTLT